MFKSYFATNEGHRRKEFILKDLMIFGSLCFVGYVYITWGVIRERRFIHVSEMNSRDLFYFVGNYILLISGFILVVMGLHKNKQIITEYKQKGIYVQGEIVRQSAIATSFNSKYTIQISKDGENKIIYVWASGFQHRNHEIVGLYYLVNQDNDIISAMLEGENSSEKGDEFLSWSALIFIYATFIYGYRHDI